MTLDLVQEPTPSLPESPAPRAVPAGRRRSTPRAHVVAVLVARDGAARLPRVLAALASATRAPDALVGVDLGSTDDSAALLAASMPVLELPRSAGPQDGVEAVLALRATAGLEHTEPFASVPDPTRAGSSGGARGAEPPVGGVVEWVWLLTHDAAPAADALEQLLLAVETAPSVGVAGCKQVAWDDDQRLLDVGFTASPLGLRVTGVDRGEVDQGQHDGRSDVLAVSGAGMLVRRDVWDALGGLDPGLDRDVEMTAADLDLCRRAHLAGYRVVVVPAAVVARATRRPPRRAARRAVLHLRLAAVPALLLPLALVAVVLLAPLRALLLLTAGRTGAAADELAATAGVLTSPIALARTRRRSGRGRRVPPSVLRTLRPPVEALLRVRYDAVHSWVTPPVPDAPPPPPAPSHRGAVVGMLLVTALAGAAVHRDLLLGRVLDRAGTGAADGPLLVPTPPDAAALWSLATATWRHVGLGAPAVADPWASLLALLAVPLGGDPALAQQVLLAAGVPLAGLLAWTAAAALTPSRVLRWWAALAWAVAPPLLTAVLAGRPAAVLAHLLLPPAALALARCRAGAGRPLAGIARLGLLLAALLAAAPALTVPVLAALAAAGALRPPAGEPGTARWRPLAAAVVPAGLLLPWWVAVARAPRLFLAAADGTLPGTVPTAGPASGVPWWHLLALPSAPDADVLGARLAAGIPGVPARAAALAAVLAAAAVAVPVVVAAVAGPLRRRAGSRAVLGWGAAGLGLLLAAVQAAVGAGAAPLPGAGFTPPGPALSLALAGLGAAALLGAQVLPGRARRTRRPDLAGRAVAAAAVLALGAPALVLAAAATAGAGAPRPASRLPAVAAAEAAGPNATRTLVLRVAGSPAQVRWALVRGSGPVLGDGSAALAARPDGPAGGSGRDAGIVLPVLARLLSGAGHDARAALAGLAVGSVVLLPPADPGTVIALDAAPGLSRLAGSGPGLLWRVDPPAGSGLARPARARVVDPGTGRALLVLPSSGDAVRADVPPGPSGRLVVLAEHADRGWEARLDSVRLPPARAGWAQGFVLPASGGHLEIMHAGGSLAAGDPGRGALLALAVLLALPMPRLRGRAGTPPPPRPSRPVPRPAPAPDDLLPGAPPRIFDEDHPEDAAPPLYVGPPPRRLRRRRKRPGGRT